MKQDRLRVARRSRRSAAGAGLSDGRLSRHLNFGLPDCV